MIEPFQPTTAAIFVVVTAVLGFIIGAVFAFIWNLFANSSPTSDR